MSQVFVSHAAKDKALVEEVMELLDGGVRLHPEDVFCTSLPGMGIPNGEDFVDHIRSKVVNPDLVIFILTPEFLKSAFCHNEVGASWALKLRIYLLLVPPCGYADLKGVLAGKQAAKLDDKEALNDMRDELTKILDLKPLGTSAWERKRDRFLSKLPTLLETSNPSTKPPSGSAMAMDAVVTSSGNWFKLANGYYRASKVVRPAKDQLVVELVSDSPQHEADLSELRPHRHGRGDSVAFAYQNDGGIVEISSATSSSEGSQNVWTFHLSFPENQRTSFFSEMDVQNHSANDIAEMRAGRLLINEPPLRKRSRHGIGDDHMIEHAIGSSGDGAVKVTGSVIQSTYAAHVASPSLALQFARLEAVYALRATNTVQSIFELSIGPIQGNVAHVKFRGQRPRRYANQEPEEIGVEGDCILTEH